MAEGARPPQFQANLAGSSPRVVADMADGARPPSTMKIISSAERQLARQLSEERDERNKAVSALWARFEDLNQQIQRLKTQLEPAQLAALLALPATAHDSPQTSETAAHVVDGAGVEVTISQEKFDSLVYQINESRVRFSAGPPEFVSTTGSPESSLGVVAAADSGTGGSLEGPLRAKADAIAALQTGVKDLQVKHQQQAKEVSYIKGVLIEVYIGVQMNAIRASRIALQSAEVSKDERNEALSALDKKELECKTFIRKVCNGPQQANLLAELPSPTTSPIVPDMTGPTTSPVVKDLSGAAALSQNMEELLEEKS